jgi:hypothetical protein
MVDSFLVAFSVLLVIVGSAHAQVSAPTCTDSTFGWVRAPWLIAQFLKLIDPCCPINALSRSTRSHRVHAKLEPTWQRRVTMVVSTLYSSPFRTLRANLSAHAAFTIPALLPQHSYTGPNGQDDNDLCKCNTVFYNLISACDACQGEPWITCVHSSH